MTFLRQARRGCVTVKNGGKIAPFNSWKSRINKLTLSPWRILILLQYYGLITNLYTLYTPPNPEMWEINCGIWIHFNEKNRTGKPATSVTEQVRKRNIKRKWTGINLVLQPLPMKRRKRDMKFVDKSPCLKPVIFFFLLLWQETLSIREKSWVLEYDVIPNTCFTHLHALSSTFRYSNIRYKRTDHDKGVARGVPGVPMTPFCKPFLTAQPTTGGENAMSISWP